MTAPDYGDELARARARFASFVAQARPPVAILADGDVDGLGAAVTLAHYLEARGLTPIHFLQVPKGGNAFTPVVRERVAAASPATLFVLDLGVRPFAIADCPTLMIDHHRPVGDSPNAITGYAWSPPPTTSLLTYLLCGDPATAWKAAIGNEGDLGPEYVPFEEAARTQRKKWMKEALSLLNSAKRSSDPETAIPCAYRLLLDADSALEVAESDDEDAQTLHRFRDEVREELAKAKRVGPKFSKKEPIALLRFDSPARVHPLLAQSWRGRLPKFIVMAANGSYMPGRVAFSMRTNLDLSILDLLARYGDQLGIDEPEYGLGHDKATGGSLPTETFERLLRAMGFE